MIVKMMQIQKKIENLCAMHEMKQNVESLNEAECVMKIQNRFPQRRKSWIISWITGQDDDKRVEEVKASEVHFTILSCLDKSYGIFQGRAGVCTLS